MARLVKNWWARLGAALSVALCIMVWIVARTPPFSAQATSISPAALFTAETAFDPDQIQRLLEQRTSPLAGYRERVGEQTLSAAQLFWVAAQTADYGFNPKALLTLLYLEDGLAAWPDGGLYQRLKEMATQLQRAAQPTDDPAVKGLAVGSPDAAALLSRYYAPRAKIAGQMRATLQEWGAAYRTLFNEDPAQPTAIKSPPTQIPFMRLPFDQPAQGFVPIESFFDHLYPGQLDDPNMLRSDGAALPGAHYTGCWRGMTCYSGHNATDFTMPTGTPIYAVAAGQVTYRLDSEGGILIDHGNGYRSVYWHLDRVIVDFKQVVSEGALLGYSGCRGTCSKPHLHFGLRLVDLSQDVDPYGWWSTTPDPVPGPSRYMWRGDLLADHGEPQMQLFYDLNWMREPGGFGGEAWYTYTTNQKGLSTNWGMWGATIPAAGRYTVSAYWPKHSENTAAALYQVWHRGGMTAVTVDQRAGGDAWFELGSFEFDAAPAVVILTDFTPDAPKDQRVYFDAVRWTAAGRPVFLPILQSNAAPTLTPPAP